MNRSAICFFHVVVLKARMQLTIFPISLFCLGDYISMGRDRASVSLGPGGQQWAEPSSPCGTHGKCKMWMCAALLRAAETAGCLLLQHSRVHSNECAAFVQRLGVQSGSGWSPGLIQSAFVFPSVTLKTSWFSFTLVSNSWIPAGETGFTESYDRAFLAPHISGFCLL